MWPVNRRTFLIVISLNIFMCESKFMISKLRTKVQQNKLEGKIVNGQTVSIETYPYAVQFQNMGRLCGGVIIHSWAITTSAHCLEFNSNTEEMIIQAGARYIYDYNADWYDVLTFVMHENYNEEQVFSYDIALVFSKRPIEFSNRVQKAVLVKHDKWMVEQEDNFVVIGWGYTKEGGNVSDVGLQMTRLKYVTREECSKSHNGYKLTSDMFCLYGGGKHDVCQGDSGGGVLWNDMLVGLTSHGNGCARKGKPSVFINIWLLRGWITKHISQFYDDFCDDKFTTDGILNQFNLNKYQLFN